MAGMFVTAVCVLFLLKLKWPKSKNFYETALISFKTQKGLESLQVRQTCDLDGHSIEEPNSEDKHLKESYKKQEIMRSFARS